MLTDQLRRVGVIRGGLLVAAVAVVVYAVSHSAFATIGDGPRASIVTGAAAVSPPVKGGEAPPATSDSDKAPTHAEAVAARKAAVAKRRRVLARRAGQLIVSGFGGPTAPPALLERIRRGQLAGVILMGENIVDVGQLRRLNDAIRQAARDGGQPTPLIMTDQEGGAIKRLRTAAPSMSAAQMGAAGPGVADGQGRRTGGDLRARGVNVDLAPVADVGPSGGFLGARMFGHRPLPAGAAACNFAQGLRAGGVVPTLKHFPGLGAAGPVSTDTRPVTVTASAAELESAWSAYRQCGAVPGTLTMVASASYPALGIDQPAVLSATTYRRLREIGIRGPVISDDLNGGAVRAQPRVAVRAIGAGATLLLAVPDALADHLRDQLRDAIAQGRLSGKRVRHALELDRTLRQHIAPAGP